MTTTTHSVDLLDHTPVTAIASWSFSFGTFGSASDTRGWELVDWAVPDYPRLSITEREHVRKQIIDYPPPSP